MGETPTASVIDSVHSRTVEGSALRGTLVDTSTLVIPDAIAFFRTTKVEEWPKEFLYDALKVVWVREEDFKAKNKAKLADLDKCEYHEHQEYVKCEQAVAAKASTAFQSGLSFGKNIFGGSNPTSSTATASPVVNIFGQSMSTSTVPSDGILFGKPTAAKASTAGGSVFATSASNSTSTADGGLFGSVRAKSTPDISDGESLKSPV